MRMLRHSTLAAVLLLSAVSPQALAADVKALLAEAG